MLNVYVMWRSTNRYMEYQVQKGGIPIQRHHWKFLNQISSIKTRKLINSPLCQFFLRQAPPSARPSVSSAAVAFSRFFWLWLLLWTSGQRTCLLAGYLFHSLVGSKGIISERSDVEMTTHGVIAVLKFHSLLKWRRSERGKALLTAGSFIRLCQRSTNFIVLLLPSAKNKDVVESMCGCGLAASFQQIGFQV